MDKTKSRPIYLNLVRIHMPVSAVVSIGHRISGVFLVLLIPVFIYLLDLSLSGSSGFAQVAELLSAPLARLVMVMIAWAFAHHFLAGIRFFFIDMDIGVANKTASQTAWWVHTGAVLCAGLTVGFLL